MTHQSETNDTCCPQFDPAPWEGKTHNWKDKPFIKDTVPQIFHTPLPSAVGKTIARMWEKAGQAQAAPEMKDFLMLAYDPSLWKSEFYLSVTREVPGAENVKFTGTFISKVFDGPFNAVPKWIKEFEQYLTGQGKTAQKYFFYYTTCAKCAKKYGHNYVVAFAQVG